MVLKSAPVGLYGDIAYSKRGNLRESRPMRKQAKAGLKPMVRSSTQEPSHHNGFLRREKPFGAAHVPTFERSFTRKLLNLASEPGGPSF